MGLTRDEVAGLTRAEVELRRAEMNPNVSQAIRSLLRQVVFMSVLLLFRFASIMCLHFHLNIKLTGESQSKRKGVVFFSSVFQHVDDSKRVYSLRKV